MHRIRFVPLFVFLAGAIVFGCGRSGLDTQPVSGKVTFDGQPIAEGRITFRGTGSDPRAFSAEIKNGQYQMEAMAGQMKVEVIASRPVPGKFDESNPGEKVPVGEMYIPAKYNSQSELTAEVTTGKNELNFDLTGGAAGPTDAAAGQAEAAAGQAEAAAGDPAAGSKAPAP